MTIHESDENRAMNLEPLDDDELLSEEEFAEEVRELVAEEAPRVFALVQEQGERDDAWVFAWGLAFEHHVEIISANGGLQVTFTSADRALQRFSRRRKIRLVWANPVTPRQPERVG